MIPMIDLNSQQKEIKSYIDFNLQEVLNHGKYIMGPEVSLLEKNLSEFIGIKHAITCASGTDAIFLSLLANNIGKGDFVLTSAFSFIAAAEAIALTGATPVFVDIDLDSFNFSTENLKNKISENIKAIIPVNLFGLPCDYDEINKSDILVIEDAAQSFGAEYNNKLSGNLSDIGCTSFFPSKPLGCYGDGGAVFTNSDSLSEKLRSLRAHGKSEYKYNSDKIGVNSRLDTIQAAILLSKLIVFKKEMKKRNEISERYTELLKDKDVKLPKVFKNKKSVWAQYSLLARNSSHREQICNRLKDNDISCEIYYPIPLHLQPVFSYLNYRKGDFPVSEYCAERIFSIPMHPYLSEQEQEQICSFIY